MDEKCHCGKPLHYGVSSTRMIVEKIVTELGTHIKVSLPDGRSWMVQRHYLALHGLNADELPNLGFEEVK